jgi:hypothetical protein
VQNATMFGTVKRASRKNRKSSSGWAARRSLATNATASTTATQNRMMTSVAPKPAVSASMIANISAASAPAPKTVPSVSTRDAVGSELSGTVIAAAMSAARPNTRLNQKIPRQLHAPTIAPPITGPRASASPETAAQTPIAWARCLVSV